MKINIYSGYLNLICSLAILLFGNSCANQDTKNNYVKDDYKAISNYFLQRHQIKLTDKITKLFVLTENGCHSCNKKFSDLVIENIENEKSLFIITATGNQIDMMPFETKRKNVIIDKNISDTTLSIFNETKVIYFKNNKIDTVIDIEARQIENQFLIIKNRN